MGKAATATLAPTATSLAEFRDQRAKPTLRNRHLRENVWKMKCHQVAGYIALQSAKGAPKSAAQKRCRKKLAPQPTLRQTQP